jgi:hypothetical protein
MKPSPKLTLAMLNGDVNRALAAQQTFFAADPKAPTEEEQKIIAMHKERVRAAREDVRLFCFRAKQCFTASGTVIRR